MEGCVWVEYGGVLIGEYLILLQIPITCNFRIFHAKFGPNDAILITLLGTARAPWRQVTWFRGFFTLKQKKLSFYHHTSIQRQFFSQCLVMFQKKVSHTFPFLSRLCSQTIPYHLITRKLPHSFANFPPRVFLCRIVNLVVFIMLGGFKDFKLKTVVIKYGPLSIVTFSNAAFSAYGLNYLPGSVYVLLKGTSIIFNVILSKVSGVLDVSIHEKVFVSHNNEQSCLNFSTVWFVLEHLKAF